MKIHGSKDCGNSPKNLFVQDMAVAFETGEIDPVTVTEDLVFRDSQPNAVPGITTPVPWLVGYAMPVEIEIQHAIAHGRTGAANGVSTYPDGSTRSFSYVFEFKNTTAKCVAVVFRYY